MWFDSYVYHMKGWNFNLDSAETSPDGYVTSYKSFVINPSVVKKYFKEMGFVNTEGRAFMAHTGNPHVNLEDRYGNVVQISWWVKVGRPVGVTFLQGLRKEAHG